MLKARFSFDNTIPTEACNCKLVLYGTINGIWYLQMNLENHSIILLFTAISKAFSIVAEWKILRFIH